MDLLKTLVDELYSTGGPEAVYKYIARLEGYRFVPPTIDQFLDEEEFLNHPDLRIGKEIYPYWRKALRIIFPDPFSSPYFQVAVTGAIGIGKTTLGLVGASYDILKLLYLADPHKKYSLIPTTKIVYMIFNVTLNLASSVLYDTIIEWVLTAPAYKKFIIKKPTLFDHRVDIVVGSREHNALGMAVFGSIIDELNFQDKISNQAERNYNAIFNRMSSRFMKGGKLPGHIWLLSSRRKESDFLEQLIDKTRGMSGTVVFEGSLWEIKPPEVLRLSGKYFLVYAGDDTKDPFIIGDENSVEVFNKSYKLDETRIIRVPVEFRDQFELDLIGSLQNIAGVSTRGVYKFFPSIEVINSAMTENNPVYREIVRLSFKDDSDFLLKYFDVEQLQSLGYSPRYIHIDLGITNDKTAISSFQIVDWVRRIRRDPQSGLINEVYDPIYKQDFVVYVESYPGEEVPIFKIRDFISDLIKIGYPVAKVSADGFQSRQLLQEINYLGIPTEIVSVDRTKNPYQQFKIDLYDKRIHLVKSNRLKDELNNLMNYKGKVDHPPQGSKDGADATVGAYWSLYNDKDKFVYINSEWNFGGKDELYLVERYLRRSGVSD